MRNENVRFVSVMMERKATRERIRGGVRQTVNKIIHVSIIRHFLKPSCRHSPLVHARAQAHTCFHLHFSSVSIFFLSIYLCFYVSMFLCFYVSMFLFV